jgi:hypothetical protein
MIPGLLLLVAAAAEPAPFTEEEIKDIEENIAIMARLEDDGEPIAVPSGKKYRIMKLIIIAKFTKILLT